MRHLDSRITRSGTWILSALLISVAIAVGFAGHSLAGSSKPHSNRYRLSFERTGTGAGLYGFYWVLEGTTTHITSRTPVEVNGLDKQAGDTLGAVFYTYTGQVELSGTVKLTESSSNNYLGQEGSGSVNAWVEMDKSGDYIWVVKFTVYCI